MPPVAPVGVANKRAIPSVSIVSEEVETIGARNELRPSNCADIVVVTVRKGGSYAVRVGIG